MFLFIKKEFSSCCKNDRAKEFLLLHCLTNSAREGIGFTVVGNMEIESLVSVFVYISSRLYCNKQVVSFFLVFLCPCIETICGSFEVLVDGALVFLIVFFFCHNFY